MFEETQQIPNIFTPQNIAIYFIVMNIIGFLIMFIDKQKAKKEHGEFQKKHYLS